MLVWRIARRPYADLSGEGARRKGGRWNERGTAVVYTASSRALAALELLVWIDPEDVPDDYVMIGISVPDDLAFDVVGVDSLPADWRRSGHPECRRRGDDWARSNRAALLQVPSAVIPEEHNWLLTPRHPGAGRIAIASVSPFSFDPRLLGLTSSEPRG